METIINNTDDTINFYMTSFPKADPTVIPKLKNLRPDTITTISPNFSADDYLLSDGEYLFLGVWGENEHNLPNSWMFVNSGQNTVESHQFGDYSIDFSGSVKDTFIVTITKRVTPNNIYRWVYLGVIVVVIATLIGLIVSFRKT